MSDRYDPAQVLSDLKDFYGRILDFGPNAIDVRYEIDVENQEPRYQIFKGNVWQHWAADRDELFGVFWYWYGDPIAEEIIQQEFLDLNPSHRPSYEFARANA